MGAALAVGCGTDTGPPPPGFDATGDWTYTAQVQDSSGGITCDDHGLLSLTVVGSNASGRAYAAERCAGSGVLLLGDSAAIPILGGTLSGSDIAFQIGECSYSGTVFSAGAQVKAEGTVSCELHVGGTIYHMGGWWRAVDVIDVTPPLVGVTLGLPVNDTAVVPGDTLRLHLTASDNRRLAFVGYALGFPLDRRDSIVVGGTNVDTVLTVVLPSLSSGGLPITVFARDSAGFRTDSGPIHLSVIDMIRRPIRAITTPAPVLGLAVDTKRQVVYLAYGTQQIDVMDLTNGTLASSITIPFRARDLDLSVSGDSLVATMDSEAALGIVNLAAIPHTAIVVPIDSGVYPQSEVADKVRVMANGKVIVSFSFPTTNSCCAGSLADYSLATGVWTRRGGANDRLSLARSWDRSRMVAAAGFYPYVQAGAYVAATDSFTPFQYTTATPSGYPVSSDSNGSRFLIAQVLFDDALQVLLSIDKELGTNANALSPDGANAYVEIGGGFLQVRTADGAVLERVRLPLSAFQFAITADGGTLIAVCGTPTGLGPPNNQVLLVALH